MNLDIKIENYDTELELFNIYFHIFKEALISEITFETNKR